MTRRVAALVFCAAAALLLGGPGAAVAGASPSRDSTGPAVSLSATPSYGAAPLLVAFLATVSLGTPTGFNWSFGDGTYLNGTDLSLVHPSHLYTTPGSYTAGVRVWEGSTSGNGSIPIHVTAAPLALRVTATPTVGTAPLTVTFQGTVSGGTGTYVSFNWTFGDGATGTGATVQYTYSHSGSYYAVLEVLDSGADEARQGVWVNVSAADASPPSQVTGLGTVGWAVVGFAVGLVVAVLAFFLRTWLSSRRRPAALSLAVAEEATPAVFLAPPAALPPPPVPADPPPAPAPSPPASETFRISQRIVLHLAGQGSPGPYDVAPPGATQAGISAALGVRQNALTNVLRRLLDGGLLEQEVRHVRGQPRRLKTYRLTPRGELLARELRHRPPRGPAE
ncbi:MAG: PKD domain-containing protein [Thermoplasmata archaeon]